MSIQEEIRRAVGAHGVWRQRLRTAVTSGRADPPAAHAASDRLCEFGRWIHTLPASECGGEHCRRAVDLHARFHREAGRVLELVAEGRTADAARAVGPGSEFERLTTELAVVLMEWSEAA